MALLPARRHAPREGLAAHGKRSERKEAAKRRKKRQSFLGRAPRKGRAPPFEKMRSSVEQMQAYEFFKQVLKLEDEELLSRVLPLVEVRQVEKRTILCRAGELQKEVGFLISGCTCSVSQDSKGREVVSCLCSRLGETTMSSFAFDQPSILTTMTLIDSELLFIPTDVVVEYVNSSPACMAVYNRLLEQSLERTATMQMLIYRGGAKERYQWFLKQYPGLIDQINNKYVASFLQMTNVTLSRLRRSDRGAETEEAVS